MAIRAQEIEFAQWSHSIRGKPVRLLKLPIEPRTSEAPESAMHRTAHEIVESFAQASRTAASRLRILVCDRWVALATVPWGAALTNSTSRNRFLRSQFGAAGFATAATDTVRFDDKASYGEPRIAVAYPESLMHVLSSIAVTLGARLESVHPLEVAVAPLIRTRAGRTRRALAVIDGERLRFMGSTTGVLTVGQSIVEPTLVSNRATSIRTLWERQRLRDSSLAQIARLSAIDMSASTLNGGTAADDDLDFVGWPKEGTPELTPAMRAALAVDPGSSLNASTTLPRRGAGGWLICGAASIVAAALGVHAYRLHHSALAKELVAQHQLRVSAPPSSPKWTREELARIQAVNVAIREINLPIGPLLRAVRPPGDVRVALLGVTVEPSAPTNPPNDSLATIKVNAESASGADMTRYVGYLARQPLIRAYLVNHTIDEADSAYPYRFSVEVSWRD